MTASGTRAEISLTEKLDEKRKSEEISKDETIPAKPLPSAEVVPPKQGEGQLTLVLTLTEIGAIAACIQTSVHAGWIRHTSDVNTVNSVLRKFHDAKMLFVKENP